jgi:hypothetical protein
MVHFKTDFMYVLDTGRCRKTARRDKKPKEKECNVKTNRHETVHRGVGVKKRVHTRVVRVRRKQSISGK